MPGPARGSAPPSGPEGAGKASELIRLAVAATLSHYGAPPPLGMITFIDPHEARSPHRVQLNPPRARSSAVERRYHTPDVVGSIPTAPTTAFRTRSSIGQSTGFVFREMEVQLLPGAPVCPSSPNGRGSALNADQVPVRIRGGAP